MRAAFAPILAVSCLAAVPAALADPTVVELYTSQGCSACPPADEMLGQLTQREDVLALSLHVDYWDWIGWKDTFGNPAFSERQLQYSEAENSSVRYTPQFIVNGTDRLAGPSGMQLWDLVQKNVDISSMTDVLSIAPGSEGRRVTLSEHATGGQLILVGYQSEATVKVLYGENAGKVITYYNVVHSWDVLGDWDGAPGAIDVPQLGNGLHRAVLAQAQVDGRPGPIIGAVKLD